MPRPQTIDRALVRAAIEAGERCAEAGHRLGINPSSLASVAESLNLKFASDRRIPINGWPPTADELLDKAETMNMREIGVHYNVSTGSVTNLKDRLKVIWPRKRHQHIDRRRLRALDPLDIDITATSTNRKDQAGHVRNQD